MKIIHEVLLKGKKPMNKCVKLFKPDLISTLIIPWG